MLKINHSLILRRGIPFPLNCNSPAIGLDNTKFIKGLVTALGVLPKNPPFELHPYKHSFQLHNYEKYIIGTFPPISYVLDNPRIVEAGILNIRQPAGVGGRRIKPPQIPFFHGNKGLMWDFLLTNAEKVALKKILQGANGRQTAKNWLINFFQQKEINYADIIDGAQRDLNKLGRYDGDDNNLNNICPNKDLICHILLNPKTKYLLFNTSSVFSNSGVVTDANGLVNVNAKTKSFDLFVRYCQELGLNVEIQIQTGNQATFFNWTQISALGFRQRKTKIAFDMKITNPVGNQKLNCEFKSGEQKFFTILTPFSPAAVNRGNTKNNFIVQNWLLNNPGQSPYNLLTDAYQSFRNNNHLPFFNMNV